MGSIFCRGSRMIRQEITSFSLRIFTIDSKIMTRPLKSFLTKACSSLVYSNRQTCATQQPPYQINNKYISTNTLLTNPLVKHIFLTAWKFIPNMKHEFLKLQTVKNGSNPFSLFSSSPPNFFLQNQLLVISAMWQPTDGCVYDEFGEVKTTVMADTKQKSGEFSLIRLHSAHPVCLNEDTAVETAWQRR